MPGAMWSVRMGARSPPFLQELLTSNLFGIAISGRIFRIGLWILPITARRNSGCSGEADGHRYRRAGCLGPRLVPFLFPRLPAMGCHIRQSRDGQHIQFASQVIRRREAMNKDLYRLVFNASRGMRVAVRFRSVQRVPGRGVMVRRVPFSQLQASVHLVQVCRRSHSQEKDPRSSTG